MNAVVLWVAVGFAVYSALVNLSYLVLTGLALADLTGYRRRLDFAGYDEWFLDPNSRGVSVLMPAYNEAATIVQSVHAMTSLRYPDLEVVVIDDGSADDTAGVLIEEFDMAEVPLVPGGTIPLRSTVLSTWVSRRGSHNLALVRKSNGGKADALNAGINHARKELVCMVDADSLLDPQALLNVARPFADDPGRVVAAGGVIRVANGSRVDRGRVTNLRMPRRWLARVQVVEYLRAFLIGRAGWSRLGGLLIISGAFGIFRKDVLLEAGGMATDCIGEDAELVVRLHRTLADSHTEAGVVFVPEPVAWTEVPATRRVLRLQRRRWHRGLAEILVRHRRMMLRPRYGVVGMITMPWFLLFELLSPVIEVLGLAYFFLLLVFLGLEQWGRQRPRPRQPSGPADHDHRLGAVLRVRDPGGTAGGGGLLPPLPRASRPLPGDLRRGRGERRLPPAERMVAPRRDLRGAPWTKPPLGRHAARRLRPDVNGGRPVAQVLSPVIARILALTLAMAVVAMLGVFLTNRSVQYLSEELQPAASANQDILADLGDLRSATREWVVGGRPSARDDYEEAEELLTAHLQTVSDLTTDDPELARLLVRQERAARDLGRTTTATSSSPDPAGPGTSTGGCS